MDDGVELVDESTQAERDAAARRDAVDLAAGPGQPAAAAPARRGRSRSRSSGLEQPAAARKNRRRGAREPASAAAAREPLCIKKEDSDLAEELAELRARYLEPQRLEYYPDDRALEATRALLAFGTDRDLRATGGNWTGKTALEIAEALRHRNYGDLEHSEAGITALLRE